MTSPPTCMDPSLSYFRHNLTRLNASCFFIHPERCLIVDLMGNKHWKCFQLEVDKTASEFRVEIWAAVHWYKYWVFISFWSCKHAPSGPFFFFLELIFFWDEFFVSPLSCHFERNNLELPTVIMLNFVAQLTCKGHTSESCDSACPVWSACFKLLSVALPCLWCCICWFFQILFFGATEVRKYRR